MLLFLVACTAEPPAHIVDLFGRLERRRQLSAEDLDWLETWLDTYHRQTTLHCDGTWRVSSRDGLRFPGPAEQVLGASSVADLAILPDGRQALVYNDTTPGRLLEAAREDPARLWRQGLVGYGGLGLAVDSGRGFEEVPLDLHLDALQEAVDPDLGVRPDGSLRLTWFGVPVGAMNPAAHGPLASHKPHRIYRATSTTLGEFPTPAVAIASTAGSTGGTDPTVQDLPDGGELLWMGPLDHTAVAWRSDDGVSWPTDAAPSVDSRLPAATPDVVTDPAGGYRMYFMQNGQPGLFKVAFSTDGLSWTGVREVYRDPDAFNVSAAVDAQGTWWLVFNRSDPACLAHWGVRRIRPGEAGAGAPPAPPLGAPAGPRGVQRGEPPRPPLHSTPPQEGR